jgi:hypothetical protein
MHYRRWYITSSLQTSVIGTVFTASESVAISDSSNSITVTLPTSPNAADEDSVYATRFGSYGFIEGVGGRPLYSSPSLDLLMFTITVPVCNIGGVTVPPISTVEFTGNSRAVQEGVWYYIIDKTGAQLVGFTSNAGTTLPHTVSLANAFVDVNGGKYFHARVYVNDAVLFKCW